MENNRALSLYLFIVLKKYSNRNQSLNASQIAAKIKEEFNLTKEPDRRTIYEHIKLLKDLSDTKKLNCEIISNEKGNYIESDFDESEIQLLCDAIASSRFISGKYSSDLIVKLGQILGKNFTRKYGNILQFKSSANKTYNPDLFSNIEILTDAIEENKKVTFQYLKYDIHKRLIPKNPLNDGYKTVSPYYLIWAVNHYYLFCRDEDRGENRFLRVDKIKDVTVLEKTKIVPLPKEFNIHEYARNQVFMFGGEAEPIRFRCELRMLGQVIDFFGEDAELKPIDENYFEVKIKTSIDSIKYWILQYITAIDDIRPEKLRTIIVEFLEDALRRNKA